MNIKELNEKLRQSLKENITAEDIKECLEEVREQIDTAKYRLDKIAERLEYRLVTNPSYFGKEAMNLLAAVDTEVSKVSEDLYNTCYNKIG